VREQTLRRIRWAAGELKKLEALEKKKEGLSAHPYHTRIVTSRQRYPHL
jgi:methionine aminopeptidase